MPVFCKNRIKWICPTTILITPHIFKPVNPNTNNSFS